MEADLRAMLLAADLGAERIAWGERPQGGPLPAIVLTRISGSPIYAQDGVAGMTETRVQADVWTDALYSDALIVGKALEALLSGYRGTFGSTRFHGVFSQGASDSREAGTGDADRFFRVSIDFIIHHSEI